MPYAFDTFLRSSTWHFTSKLISYCKQVLVGVSSVGLQWDRARPTSNFENSRYFKTWISIFILSLGAKRRKWPFDRPPSARGPNSLGVDADSYRQQRTSVVANKLVPGYEPSIFLTCIKVDEYLNSPSPSLRLRPTG